jgi:hypothetical protein
MGGDYELRGDRLVRLPGDERPALVYEWDIRTRHMLNLARQPKESRPADYRGAVLFRSNGVKR